MGLVPDGDNVRVNIGKDLAAGGAAQAGALTFAADVCRGKIARGGRAVALAGEDDGMAQRAVSGRRADLPGQCAVFR